MRPFALILAASVAIISGCRDNSGIRGYWSDRDLCIDDYEAAEEEFTNFVEQAVQAPQADAFAAVDVLIKKARKDEVTYLVYAEMILRGFGAVASPCHSCPIFLHASDRMLSKGIPSAIMTERYERRREFCLHNNVGDKAEIPQLVKGSVPQGVRTLLLVVDQDCSTCMTAMHSFSGPEWEDASKVALCYGRGSLPEDPDWECFRLSEDQSLLDTHEGPFFYVVSPEGKVEISYTSVYENN